MTTLSPCGFGVRLALRGASRSASYSLMTSQPARVVPHGAPAKYVPFESAAAGASPAFERGSTAARQKALAAAYPDEYVVLVGVHVVAHTKGKEEAYAHSDEAFEQGDEPIVVPPGALRQVQPPVVRGRMFAGSRK
jgi:hypothetical protein